ncbi:MAG: MarR family winged helix-turn-helix transcriptional regulator, partial [Chloroflexota bacterium]
TYAMPTARTSREEIERALGVLAGRETRRRVYTRIAARAGLALDPSSSWLLFRIDQYAPATLEDLSTRLHVPSTGLGPILDRLTQAGLAAVDHDSDGKPGQIVLTPSGRQARDRLVAARRDGLTDLLAGWPPEQQNELADLLGRLARGLLGDDPGGKTLAEAPLAAPTRRG